MVNIILIHRNHTECIIYFTIITKSAHLGVMSEVRANNNTGSICQSASWKCAQQMAKGIWDGVAAL